MFLNGSRTPHFEVCCHHSAQRGSSHLFSTSNVEGIGIMTWWRGWAQCRQVKWSFLSNLVYRVQWFTKRTALHTTFQPNLCWKPRGAMILMCCRGWGKTQQDGELHHERYVGGMRERTEETWDISSTYFAKTPQNSIQLSKSQHLCESPWVPFTDKESIKLIESGTHSPLKLHI